MRKQAFRYPMAPSRSIFPVTMRTLGEGRGGDASSAGNANVVLAYADVITIPASKMFSYMQQFRGPWVPQNAVDLLNKLVSPSAPRGPWSFKSCFAAP
jgi:hypothetical protein